MPRQTKQQVIETLQSENSNLTGTLHVFQERMNELELAIENVGWDKLAGGSSWDFSRVFLNRLISLSRLMFLKNPLIGRAVWVETFYVWALGWSVDCEDKEILKVIKGYIKDPKNKALFTQNSLFDMNNTRQVTGNLFLVHFTNKETGVVRTRRVDIEQIADVIYNPNDNTEPWFYVRTMTDGNNVVRTVVYPDINYMPLVSVIPDSVKRFIPANPEVQWNNPMSMFKTGGFESMKLGVPEVYAALDWATAYKAFLEDWATLMRAYARIAMTMSGNKKSDIPGAKSKLEIGRNGNTGANAAPGGWMVSSGGVDLKAVKTAGATTSAEEGYSIKLMVAAAVGIPGTFFGDADVGNFATSATLDRPTELKMVARQRLWGDDFKGIFQYVVLQSVLADKGALKEKGYSQVEIIDDVEKVRYYTVISPEQEEDEEDIRESIRIDFPNIIERNVTERIRGVVGALTLNGNLPTDVIPDRKFQAKVILEALGLDPAEVEEQLESMFPEGKPVPPIPPPPAPIGPFGGNADAPPAPKANKGRKGPAGGGE